MNHKIIANFVRPNTGIEFYDDYLISTGETFFLDYIQENLIVTNLMTVNKVLSNNDLTVTVERNFTDDGYSLWWNDPTIESARQDLINYNANNGISAEFQVI